MICFPNAKINLGLNIVEKRPDGYHNIETVFYPIPIKDALEITEAPATSFTQTGIPVDAPAEKNLVMKALRAIKQNYTVPELQIGLLKAIPFGAGLGGGSADAAFMLKLVNQFAHLQISDDELERIASTIGADCPFFIRNQPVFATGIGNVFQPVRLSLAGWYLCLVKPDVAVSTAAAYAQVKPSRPAVSLCEIINRPVSEWKDLMVKGKTLCGRSSLCFHVRLRLVCLWFIPIRNPSEIALPPLLCLGRRIGLGWEIDSIGFGIYADEGDIFAYSDKKSYLYKQFCIKIDFYTDG